MYVDFYTGLKFVTRAADPGRSIEFNQLANFNDSVN